MPNYTTRYSLLVGGEINGIYADPIFKEDAGIQYPQIFNEETQEYEDDLENPYYNAYNVSKKPAHKSRGGGRETARLQKANPDYNFYSPPYEETRSQFLSSWQKHTINFRRQQQSFEVLPLDSENVTVVANFARKDWEDDKDASNTKYPNYGLYGAEVYPTLTSIITSTPFVAWLAGEDVNIGTVETSDTRFKARFGASPKSKSRMLRNPFYNKGCPKLKPEKEDSLIFVCEVRDNAVATYLGQECYVDNFNSLYTFDSFFSLKSIDAQEYQNKDHYVVINMGNFKFENGVVYDYDGPFNIDIEQFAYFYKDILANES